MQLTGSGKSYQQHASSRSSGSSKKRSIDEISSNRSLYAETSYKRPTSSSAIEPAAIGYPNINGLYVDRHDSTLFNPPPTGAAGEGGEVELTAYFLDPLPYINIVTHNQIKENFTLLQSYAPSSVILYDNDVFIVRKLEGYQSMIDRQITIYFLNYGKPYSTTLSLYPYNHDITSTLAYVR